MDDWQAGLIEQRLTEVERGQRGLAIAQRQQSRPPARTRDKTPPLGESFISTIAAKVAQMAGHQDLAEQIQSKAATPPARTDIAGWASELTAHGVAGFILSLTGQAATALILARSPQVKTLGVGAVVVPFLAAPPAASVVPEGAPIPVLKSAFSPLTATPFKIAAICTFTDELNRVSTIQQSVRLLVSESVALGLDKAFFSATPPGVLAGVTPLTPAASGTLAEKVIADLAALAGALTAPSASIVFAMGARNYAVASAVLPNGAGYTLVPSSQIADKTVIAIDPAGIGAALGEEKISLSQGALLHESDTPTAIGTVGGPDNVVAAPARSLFQTDSVAVRIILDAAWATRPGAVAVVNNTGW